MSEIFDENGEEVRLRGTLLPLSSNGDDIDAILGADSCARMCAIQAGQPAAAPLCANSMVTGMEN